MTRRPLGECAYCCGKPAVQRHHPTGEEIDRDYLVPVCHDHHRLSEDDWHSAGVGAKDSPITVMHGLQIGLTRWAMLLGRLAKAGVCAELLTTVARWMAEKAAFVGRMIDAFDRRYGPDWHAALDS
jgi:DNA-binding transcriptional LysR family regulator